MRSSGMSVLPPRRRTQRPRAHGDDDDDDDGELTRTIAYKVGFGKMQARRMMFTGKVTLNEDGTVSGKPYVDYWSYE
jgi:hypothetical protein